MLAFLADLKIELCFWLCVFRQFKTIHSSRQVYLNMIMLFGLMVYKEVSTTKFYETMNNLMWNDLSLNYDLKPILIKYKGRCSIIRPRQDPVPAESIYQIKDILPQTEIYFIEKSGHFPDYEKPKELFRILREVL